jgi:hypothetical protein
MQGPRPATSTHLIPPRVVTARRASTTTSLVKRKDQLPSNATEIAATLKRSHDASLARLKDSLTDDPLARASTTTEILLRVEASRRQLQTLELLLTTDQQKLAILNSAAKDVIDVVGLVVKLESESDIVEPGLLAELRSLVPQNSLADFNEDDIAADADPRGSRNLPNTRFARFLASYPRALLSTDESSEVNDFANTFHETLDEVQLLEMLQLHESQSLGNEEARLRALRAIEDNALKLHNKSGDAETVVGSSPVRIHHAAPVSAHYVPAPGMESYATTSSPLRLRPVWVKYFAYPQAANMIDSAGTDDQKCCMLIEDLLGQIDTLRQSLDDEALRASKTERELDSTSRQLALREDESVRLHDALTTTSSQREELRTMLVYRDDDETQLKAELGKMGARNLELAESIARQSWYQTESAKFGDIEKTQLREFLMIAARQRSDLERMLATERRAVEIERKKQQRFAEAEEDHEDIVRGLREELASIGAERALLKAKVEMYQQTIRVDQDRHNKSLSLAEAEVNALRDRTLYLEAQLDVHKSTSVSRTASFKAVQQQKDWDHGTLVRQLSMNSTMNSSVNSRVLLDDAGAPVPRSQQPPRPSS